MAENALAPEQKLPKAPPVLPDDEVLYELARSEEHTSELQSPC